MVKYILHYFPVNGRAVVPRAILSYCKADWTDDRIAMQDWPKIKKSGLCEFEQLPILEVEGKKYSQSNAINIYLAETFNLMGKNAEENYQITNLLMTFDDFMGPIFGYMFCKDESKKEEMHKNALEKAKFFIGQIEKRYITLGKGKYFLGDKFTLADIYIATAFPAAFDALKMKECPCKEVAPNLAELIKRIKENELKEFYEKYYVK